MLTVAGCTSDPVVSTGEWETVAPMETATTPPLPPVDNTHMVDASDYAAHPNYQTAYYFSTPSGRWQCAIIPRRGAGCQAAGAALGIAGAPDTVPNAAGEPMAPNAVVVESEGDAHFVALDQPEFSLVTGPATVLPFNRTLIVAGFRCNIQEQSGIGCMSEQSGTGFTFSADGFQPQYTEVPVDAP
jgi:hypothetical protein